MNQLKMLAAILVTVILIINRVHKATACLEGSLPTSEWTSDTEIEDFRIRDRDDENTVILVARDFVFNCNGYVNQWTIQWYHREAWTNCVSVLFNFYVFRQSDQCSELHLVGESSFTVIIGENSDDRIRVESVFEVDHEERIMVQAGDFVAVSVSLLTVQCSDIRIRIAGIRNLNIMNTVYHGLFSSLGGLSSTMMQPCMALTVDESTIPFITAVVNPTTTPTHDPVPNPSSVTSDTLQPIDLNPTSTSTVMVARTANSTTSAGDIISDSEGEVQGTHHLHTGLVSSTSHIVTSTDTQRTIATQRNAGSVALFGSHVVTSSVIHGNAPLGNSVVPTTSVMPSVGPLPDTSAGSTPPGISVIPATSVMPSVGPLPDTSAGSTQPGISVIPATSVLLSVGALPDTNILPSTSTTSTEQQVDTGIQRRDQLILIGMGAGSGALFLLVITVISTVLCLLRYLYPKEHRKGAAEENGEQNHNTLAVASKECRDHTDETDMYYSPLYVGLGNRNVRAEPAQVGHMPSSLHEDQSFMMTINGSYGSLTKL